MKELKLWKSLVSHDRLLVTIRPSQDFEAVRRKLKLKFLADGYGALPYESLGTSSVGSKGFIIIDRKDKKDLDKYTTNSKQYAFYDGYPFVNESRIVQNTENVTFLEICNDYYETLTEHTPTEIRSIIELSKDVIL